MAVFSQSKAQIINSAAYSVVYMTKYQSKTNFVVVWISDITTLGSISLKACHLYLYVLFITFIFIL